MKGRLAEGLTFTFVFQCPAQEVKFISAWFLPYLAQYMNSPINK